jgi:hypothetical protein
MLPSFRTFGSFLGFLLIFSISSFAQNSKPDPIKFGKVDIADLQMKVYAKDSTADAVVLCDYGNVYYRYSNIRGFVRVFERTRRIKIFKKSAYEWATHLVGIRHRFSKMGEPIKEDFEKVKGVTYNLVNGKIVESKLKNEDIIEEKKTDDVDIKKFTLPNVQEGSVLEYTYTIASDLNYIPEWDFQRSIPTLWSEYRVSIPEYYIFRVQFQGYENLTTNEQTHGTADFRITQSSERVASEISDAILERSESTTRTISANTTNYRWVLQNAPAIRNEAYITTIEDYVDRVSFDLASVRLPNSPHKNFSTTWKDLSNDLMSHEKFGSQLAHFSFLKNAAENIKKQAQDTLGRIALAHDFVRKNVKWNSHEGTHTENGVKTAYEGKIGNNADMNLMLVGLLRELGYSSNPVILSTRSNGYILESYLLLSKFNYTIAHVDVGGKDLLLDATEPFVKVGALPVRCLNGIGRLIVNKEFGRWVSLASTEKATKTVLLNVNLDEKGQLAGNWDVYYSGYSGIDERQKLSKLGNERYASEFKKSITGLEIKKSDIANIDDLSQALVLKNEVKTDNVGQTGGDRIYFKPMLSESREKNPFVIPNRKYPVDFSSPIEETFKATYQIPKGYVVEEVPKNIKMTLSEDGGMYSFLIRSTPDGKLMVSSRLVINKTTFYAEEYDGLKQFFDQIIAKHAEQIVLKKQ